MRVGAAIVLEVVFAVMAFGVRSVVQWRRTGSTGYVLPGRNASFVELLGAGLFILAIVGLGVAPAGNVDLLDHPFVGALGAVLAAGGILLCLVAQLGMGDSWRIGVDEAETTDLVTAGLFASIRNPIFTAMLVATVGFVLLVPNVWSIGALVALVVGLELQVRYVEEPYLLDTHGATYLQYTQQAGRFLPGIGHSVAR
jgi:protein-S-isoprenylcysteine O-methyltransferase Ste14